MNDHDNKCHCFILHPVTPDERKAVAEKLDYARKVGDNIGIMLATAQLAGCPPHTKRTRA